MSPPVGVLFENSRSGWSCASVKTTAPTTIPKVIQPSMVTAARRRASRSTHPGPRSAERVDELPGRRGRGPGRFRRCLLEEVGHTRPVISPDMFASHHRP